MPPRTSQKPYMKVFARPRLAANTVIEYNKIVENDTEMALATDAFLCEQIGMRREHMRLSCRRRK